VHDADHINMVSSNMIDDSVRTLEHFADLAYLELRHDTSGKREDTDLFAATGPSTMRLA